MQAVGAFFFSPEKFVGSGAALLEIRARNG